jgi:DNA-binding NarL/FixJ family response regulator
MSANDPPPPRERASGEFSNGTRGPRPSGSASIRVLLVDDQPLLRLGFRMVIDAHDDMTVVGEAGDGAEAMRLTAELAPDVVLMDVRMPGTDGIEATRQIAQTADGPRVLILTTFDLDAYAFSGLRAGASGFLLKDVPPSDLLSAIRAVASGDAVVAPSVTRRLLDAYADRLPEDGAAGAAAEPVADERVARLTEREHEVLLEVAAGRSNAEIAARLVVTEATVKTHVGRVLTKLELRDRVQAVIFAYECGLAGGQARR